MNSADFPPNPLEKDGYGLEFNDEFEGQSLDPAKWVPYYLPQWSSREKSAPHYEFTEDGFALCIDADQAPWCSEFDGDVKCSSIQTGVFAGALGSAMGQHHFKPNLLVREEQTTQRLYTPHYGYFEMRMKAIQSANNLVALWMIGFEEKPEESGEIVVFEVFGDKMTPTASEVRYGVKAWQDPTLTDAMVRDVLPIDASHFHIYAVEWTPTHIDFYVDNVKRRTLPQSPHYPMQLMLGIYELPNTQLSSDTYPKQFVIDYCRGYQPLGGYR